MFTVLAKQLNYSIMGNVYTIIMNYWSDWVRQLTIVSMVLLVHIYYLIYMFINKYPYCITSTIPSRANIPQTPPPPPPNSINVWQGPLFLLTLSALSQCSSWPCWLCAAGLQEGIVFDLKCLPAHRCPSDECLPSAWWLHVLSVLMWMCAPEVRTAGKCMQRGITEKGEGHTKLPRDKHVLSSRQRWSCWFIRTVEQRRPTLAHLCSSTSTAGPQAKITDAHIPHPKWNRGRGILCKPKKSCQIKLIQSVWCCVTVLLDIIQILNNLYDYTHPNSHDYSPKLGTAALSCRTQTRHNMKRKLSLCGLLLPECSSEKYHLTWYWLLVDVCTWMHYPATGQGFKLIMHLYTLKHRPGT